MRNRASGTSQMVTVMRALADAGVTEVRDFSDPTAMALLPPGWRAVVRTLGRRLGAHPERVRRMFERSDGKMDFIALRTRVLDAAWSAAHAEGARQLVLLGAGLDGRAFRLDDVGDSAVFEIDHPATQADKRRRTAAMQPRAARHAYVPVDFERDTLAGALRGAGHRIDDKTFWIWEGVTQYLTADAQETTLDAVGALSAPGSRIALTYVVPGTPSPSPISEMVRRTVDWLRVDGGHPPAARARRAPVHRGRRRARLAAPVRGGPAAAGRGGRADRGRRAVRGVAAAAP